LSTLHVVTGGSGYFGNLLVAKLLERGERVRVFDILDATDRPHNVEFVQGDIRDKHAVQEAVSGATTVHHSVAMGPLEKDKDAVWASTATAHSIDWRRHWRPTSPKSCTCHRVRYSAFPSNYRSMNTLRRELPP
jgi:NAD(P)-dependent dehydrogenase (short-subunit alcohol dehydrogenase family)